MLLGKPGRGTKDKRQSASGFFYNLLNRQYFWDSVARKTELAAAKPLTVIMQPGAGIKVSRIKNRRPITVLESACSYQDHADKIGEDLVKIKGKTDEGKAHCCHRGHREHQEKNGFSLCDSVISVALQMRRQLPTLQPGGAKL